MLKVEELERNFNYPFWRNQPSVWTLTNEWKLKSKKKKKIQKIQFEKKVTVKKEVLK